MLNFYDYQSFLFLVFPIVPLIGKVCPLQLCKEDQVEGYLIHKFYTLNYEADL